MSITAIKHFDESEGTGYYLVSEDFDRIWYKGETAEEAVAAFCKEHPITDRTITIIEEV